MTKPKHTPGPWNVLLHGRPKKQYLYEVVDTPSPTTDAEEAYFNARLIAAAPRLLKTLDDLVYRLTNLNSEGKLEGLKLDALIREGFDAISEAEGRE